MTRTQLAWLAVAALSLAQPAFAAEQPDAWVTTRVKSALLTASDVAPPAVSAGPRADRD